MTGGQWRAIAFGVAVHVARFGVIVGALAAAGALGVSGWYLGLAANVACVLFAAALTTWRRAWRASGILVAWRGRAAALLLVSGCYGAALAAFQYRYRRVLPLILLHAAADFTTILSRRPLTDPVIAVTVVGFLVLAVVLIRGRPERDRMPV